MKNSKLKEEEFQEGLEKYRALYENAPLPYQSLNSDGCYKDVNPAWLRTLGYEREEIIGEFFGDFLHPDSNAHFKKKFAEFKRRGSVNGVEFKIRHKKGHWLDISFEGCIGYNADGSFKQTYCVFQDISNRRSADEALRENEKLLRTIAENYPNSYISIIEEDLTVSYASGQEFKNRKLDPEQFIGLTVNQIFGKQGAIVKKNYKKTFKGEACNFELFIDEQHQLYRTIPLVSEDGSIHRILTVVENITQRVKAEEDVSSLLQHLETAQEMAALGYYERNLSTGEAFWSKGMYKIFGFKPDDIKQTATAVMGLIHPDDREAEIKKYRAAITAEAIFESEFRYIKRDGDTGWIHTSGITKKNKQGQMIHKGTLQDITPRKQAEEDLLESERRLSTLMSNLPGMAYRCHNDPNWTMEFISSGCMALTGYKSADLLGNQDTAYSELIHPDDRTMVWTTVQNSLDHNEPYEMEYRIITAEDKQKFVLEMGTGIFKGDQIQFLEGFIMDITERKQVEEKVLRNQDHLEELVKERTKDIEAKNKELERFNKLFVGREFRIKELREEIKKLEKRLQNK